MLEAIGVRKVREQSAVAGMPLERPWRMNGDVYLDGTAAGTVYRDAGLDAYVNREDYQIQWVNFAIIGEKGNRRRIALNDDTVIVLTDGYPVSLDKNGYRFIDTQKHVPMSIKRDGSGADVPKREEGEPEPERGPETEPEKSPQPPPPVPEKKDDTDPDSLDESKPPVDPDDTVEPEEADKAEAGDGFPW